MRLLIYAGGITVLYVFSILLTSSQGDKAEDLKGYKLFVGLGAALASLGICLWITLRPTSCPRISSTANCTCGPSATR